MKRLLIGAALCALFAAPGFAGEPVKLSSAQMDQVTAGFAVDLVDICKNCANVNETNQTAVAVAIGGSSKFSWKSSNAFATAVNSNTTFQEIN